MKTKLTQLLIALGMLTSVVSCTGSVIVDGGYYPYEEYVCDDYYDSWGYYLYTDCYWVYYSSNGAVAELDIDANAADIQTAKVEAVAKIYEEKFTLSSDKAMKLAKNVTDFSALSSRTESDLADFSQRLYGVNPSEIMTAVAGSQVGNNAALDSLVEKAAANFETSSDNMKAIIKELHGKALSENGINL